ncbi:MAG: peptidylprolyl isomerase [Candidatus Sulfotelmatobacter sp.]
MKQQLAIWTVVLTALAGTATAQQMAVSHTPTTAAQPAASTGLQLRGAPVARVNGTVLTDRDLMREMYSLFPYAAQHNGQIPPEMAPQIRQGALKMIVFEELLYQEAMRRQMTVPPAKLQKAEADFRGRFSSPEEYQQFLKEEYQGSEKALHQKIRRSLLIDAIEKAEVENKSTVTAAEVKAYYDKNPARFEHSEAFAIQTISIMPPQQGTAANLKEMRKRADEALKQAKATNTYEQFGMLAEKISDDDYRVMMGDHKKVERTKLPPDVVKVLLGMKDGEVTDVIPMGEAFTIIRLNGHIPAGETPFDEVKDSLQRELQKNKVEEVRSSLDKRLRKTAKVEEL